MEKKYSIFAGYRDVSTPPEMELVIVFEGSREKAVEEAKKLQADQIEIYDSDENLIWHWIRAKSKKA